MFAILKHNVANLSILGGQDMNFHYLIAILYLIICITYFLMSISYFKL